MTDLASKLASIGDRSPPAPIAMVRAILTALPEFVEDDDFEVLVDLVLRLRADCIAVHKEAPEYRNAYRETMLEMAERIAPAFVARPQQGDASQFFRNFSAAARDIS